MQNCYVESVSVYTHQCRSLPADSSSKRLMIITGSVWKLFLCIIDLCIYMYMLLLLVSLDFFSLYQSRNDQADEFEAFMTVFMILIY